MEFNQHATLIESIINTDFSEAQRAETHLDHAASTICANSVLFKVFQDFQSNLYTNPHSQSPASIRTNKQIQSVRERICNFFGTSIDVYDVVFTLNATHAMKLVGESFPFEEGSEFICLKESAHNSLLGVREFCCEKSGRFGVLDVQDIESNLQMNKQNEQQPTVHHLFAYPAECNSTGKKYPQSWTDHIQSKTTPFLGSESKNGQWHVLLDAAKFASTNTLDLDVHKPDFVSVSFYKIFGYPSGLGALLVRRDTNVLQKRYFSGGTVVVSAGDVRYHELRKSIHERFEDGTIPFMNVIALGVVMDELPKLCGYSDPRSFINFVSSYTGYLNEIMYNKLLNTNHHNGSPVCEIYSYHSGSSIINMNFLRSDGSHLGYSTVTQAAHLHNINLRSGCFCNPGACHKNLKLTAEDQRNHYAQGHVCWDNRDVIAGKPTGSIRISWGWCSTLSDVEKFMNMVHECLVEKNRESIISSGNQEIYLSKLYIYPIKSCAAMEVIGEWPLTEAGPLFDREWTIVDQKGSYLSQKKHPRMSLITPRIDLDAGAMFVSCGQTSIRIDLNEYPQVTGNNYRVCGSKVEGLIYKEDVNSVLSDFLEVTCFLVRKSPLVDRYTRGTKDLINFSNEAQFLMVSRASLDDLNNRLFDEVTESSDWLIERFRPNLVVEGNIAPYSEDLIKQLRIGNVEMSVVDLCNRCTMICVDRETLTVTSEPLRTLMQYRRDGSRVLFGILLSLKTITPQNLRVHDKVIFENK
ncbi:molybdenum cofactor sulfurtransferase [Acrasis kona]|uniref:Molybdenum cofactor sulfurase n=1 Tax=Acrasis kona TaxID=1008807 RepID=A0AAW2YK92_9EUKA